MMPNNDLLIRHHVVPRRHLHVPASESCPLPIEWLDVKRETFTNLDHGDLHWIEDCWTADAREGTSRELYEEFWGRTVYTLLKKKPISEWTSYQASQGNIQTRTHIFKQLGANGSQSKEGSSSFLGSPRTDTRQGTQDEWQGSPHKVGRLRAV